VPERINRAHGEDVLLYQQSGEVVFQKDLTDVILRHHLFLTSLKYGVIIFEFWGTSDLAPGSTSPTFGFPLRWVIWRSPMLYIMNTHISMTPRNVVSPS
jgi:hypothetical protein